MLAQCRVKSVCIRGNYEVLQGVDGLVTVKEWNLFESPGFEKMEGLMKSPFVFGGRNILSITGIKSKGFTFFGIVTGTNQPFTNSPAIP